MTWLGWIVWVAGWKALRRGLLPAGSGLALDCLYVELTTADGRPLEDRWRDR